MKINKRSFLVFMVFGLIFFDKAYASGLEERFLPSPKNDQGSTKGQRLVKSSKFKLIRTKEEIAKAVRDRQEKAEHDQIKRQLESPRLYGHSLSELKKINTLNDSRLLKAKLETNKLKDRVRLEDHHLNMSKNIEDEQNDDRKSLFDSFQSTMPLDEASLLLSDKPNQPYGRPDDEDYVSYDERKANQAKYNAIQQSLHNDFIRTVVSSPVKTPTKINDVVFSPKEDTEGDNDGISSPVKTPTKINDVVSSPKEDTEGDDDIEFTEEDNNVVSSPKEDTEGDDDGISLTVKHLDEIVHNTNEVVSHLQEEVLDIQKTLSNKSSSNTEINDAKKDATSLLPVVTSLSNTITEVIEDNKDKKSVQDWYKNAITQAIFLRGLKLAITSAVVGMVFVAGQVSSSGNGYEYHLS